MKGSGDHCITLPFNNKTIVSLIMGISSLGFKDIYTVSQKKLGFLAWEHLRKPNFFWDTLYEFYNLKFT